MWLVNQFISPSNGQEEDEMKWINEEWNEQLKIYESDFVTDVLRTKLFGGL